MFGIQMTFYRPLVRHPLTGVPLHLYYLFTVLHLQTLQHWCLTPPLLIFSSGFIDKILKVSTFLGKQAFKYGFSTWNWDACPERSISAQAVLRIFAKSPDSRWSDLFKHVLDSYVGPKTIVFCKILKTPLWNVYSDDGPGPCLPGTSRQLPSSTAPGHGVQKMVPVFSESINCDSSVFFQQFLVVNWCSLGVSV